MISRVKKDIDYYLSNIKNVDFPEKKMFRQKKEQKRAASC